jgi:hypothetical protein
VKTFADKMGRVWHLSIDVGSIRRVKASPLGINLADALDGKLLERLSGDLLLMADVLCELCRPEAKKENISEDAFYESLAGEVLEKATTAFMEELADFFPAGRGTVIRKALAKLKKLQGMATDKATEILDSPKLEELMRRQLNDLSGTAQESSESTRIHSLSAS